MINTIGEKNLNLKSSLLNIDNKYNVDHNIRQARRREYYYNRVVPQFKPGAES